MRSQVRPLSLTDLLQWVGAGTADARNLIFTPNGIDTSSTLEITELAQKGLSMAHRLAQSADRGSRAIICLPTGSEFFISFFGCLLSGVIAVPVQAAKTAQGLARTETIARECGATIFLTSTPVLKRIEALDPSFLHRTNMQPICVDTIDDSGSESFDSRLTHARTDEPAYLQFTSGSTGVPRGVMVSHTNAITNLDIVDVKAGRPRNGTVVSWLPLYHDMGLISALYALYAGHRLVLLSPTQFVQQPWRWLKAVSEFQAVYSGGPNFAYELCNQIQLPGNDSLDLSSWQFAFCGAEMVRPATLRRFAQRFEPFNFNARALSPAYGLAESTLIVSGVSNHETANVRTLGDQRMEVSECGTPGMSHVIRIVDPEKHEMLPDGTVGEIWVTGASKALGYWNRPEESRATFEALLPGDPATYLRTGDLGFIQAGRLYVTGRMKELVIVRGRNYHPHEIEDAVRNAHPALSATVVAFSTMTDVDEELVVICELRRTSRRTATPEITMAIQNELVRHLDLKAGFIGLLKPGAVPRTTSGKIQRLKCKENYQSGLFAFVSLSEPPTIRSASIPIAAAPKPMRFVIEDWLVQWLSFRLKIPVEQIDRTQPLSAYGMDSLTAVQLSQSLEDWLEQPMPETLAWSYPTIEQLSAQLEQTIHELPQKIPHTSETACASHSQVDLALRSVERMSEGEVEQMFNRRLVEE